MIGWMAPSIVRTSTSGLDLPGVAVPVSASGVLGRGTPGRDSCVEAIAGKKAASARISAPAMRSFTAASLRGFPDGAGGEDGAAATVRSGRLRSSTMTTRGVCRSSSSRSIQA